ncbi:hypothetical protein FFWV33_08205 [Flavobacterium faecale]|uniref:DUF3667 domain-containing protein n=1 Tax=Flavobacterium faecale TaxID=1355330 RepID=A0A2S1LCN5_9FLAO|nr:DUF3667 domain-containing protein [Flavobacterium faecale]AWG21512.1 hypothetical protein FFWV33_08205 [Flavobacterium faecale]
MNCKNCSQEVNDNFCSHCGQPTAVKRIDGHYIVHEIEHVLHFERGILFTVKELIIAPGETVRNYILDNRNRLVKPIIFIIITSLIYTITANYFHVEDGYMKYDGDQKSALSSIFKWMNAHYGYANIFMGAFIALWAKLLFKKYQFNFFEILIMLCFVMGMGMLFYAVAALVQGLTHLEVMPIGTVVIYIYMTWAIGQFFDKTKKVSYLKAFGATILGSITFVLAVVILSLLIYSVTKH